MILLQNCNASDNAMYREQNISEHSQTEMIKSILSNHDLVFLCKFYRLNINFWMDRSGIDPYSMRIFHETFDLEHESLHQKLLILNENCFKIDRLGSK